MVNWNEIGRRYYIKKENENTYKKKEEMQTKIWYFVIKEENVRKEERKCIKKKVENIKTYK